MKRILFILLLLFICSCANSPSQIVQDDCLQAECPNIFISTSNYQLTQIVNYSKNFKVELVGYSGYCYTYLPANMRFAIITPQLKVTRLRPSQDTEVDFSFYAKTQKGPPEFLGKRSYFASVDIPNQETEVSLEPIRVRIPLQNDSFEIELGLDLSLAEKKYNQSASDKNRIPDTELTTKKQPQEKLAETSEKAKCGCGL